jgi:hypothetical protein
MKEPRGFPGRVERFGFIGRAFELLMTASEDVKRGMEKIRRNSMSIRRFSERKVSAAPSGCLWTVVEE